MKTCAPSYLSSYVELLKSKQTILLIYTAFFVYLITAWTSSGISLWTLSWLMVSLFLAVSGSTMLNMYIDRDIDAVMERTKNRPLPSGRILPSTVLKHGILFVIIGVLVAGVFLNFVTMIVIFGGFFFDVIIYSLLLKRRTRYSIIFGGIAGGLPAIAGSTSVLGTVDTTALLFGLFVLCWIPLHILTLALLPENILGYKNANVPMWPVVTSKEQTIRVISLSTLLSSLFIVLTGFSLEINILFLSPLLLLCLYLIILASINLTNPSNHRTFRLFKLASIFMAFTFFWFFLTVVLTSLF